MGHLLSGRRDQLTAESPEALMFRGYSNFCGRKTPEKGTEKALPWVLVRAAGLVPIRQNLPTNCQKLPRWLWTELPADLEISAD